MSVSIRSEEIDKIISELSYRKIMEYSGVSPSTAQKWKSGEKDWRKARFEAIERLYRNYKEDLNMIEVNGITWVRTNDDVITAYKDNKILGLLSQNDGTEWKKILEGIDPIEEGWEDGIGNILSYDGWGN